VTEQELLQAVLAAPDDDAPRAAFAALKEQEGDPRGRFIRMQLTLASLEAGAPGIPFLSTETGELIEQHGAAWAASVAPLVSGYRFHRGFVAEVTLTARDFLAHAPRLFAAAPIQHLNLRRVAGDAAALFASPHLARIRSLELNQCGLDDDAMRLLAASPHLGELRWLALVFNRVGLPGAEAIAASRGLPRLTYVDFAGNEVDPGRQHATDQGVVADSWLPEEGEYLDHKYGPLAWLHYEAKTMDDLPPSRYR
jgi:uncharacterized protein (TIGR02996 family)